MVEKAETLLKSRRYDEKGREEKADSTDILATNPKTGEKILFRCLPVSGTIGVRHIEKLIRDAKKKGVTRSILVGGGKYSYPAKNKAKESMVELIAEAFPTFNIFDHEMVSKHEILPESSVAELLFKYRIQPYQLPWITVSDPAVRAIGAKPGDVLKITRKSITAGESVAYRYVVRD
jgi:DNA-directed RNA polymerase subunit H